MSRALHEACSLVGAGIRAAVIAKAPRRTVAAVAATSLEQALRVLMASAPAPAAMSVDSKQAAVAALARAEAVRQKKCARRAARRKRLKEAKSMKPQAMCVDNSSQPAAVHGPGLLQGAELAPQPSAAVAPSQMQVDDIVEPSNTDSGHAAACAAAAGSDGESQEPGPAPVIPHQLPAGHAVNVDDDVIVVGGEFQGAAGVVFRVTGGMAFVKVSKKHVHREKGTIEVNLPDLMVRGKPASGKSHATGKQGSWGRKQGR